MIKRHSALICLAISVVLIVVATLLYPGGSLHDANSVGFEWSKNFFSNLFAAKAINGQENTARIWAMVGMAFHSVGYGIFFINMSKKITDRHAATVLRVVGAANVVFSFLIATPLHDPMITISSTLTLLGLFYITVYILRTKLHVLKFSCIIGMLIFYYTLYLYGAGNLVLLAIMQKVAAVCFLLLVLALEYFTQPQDFAAVQKVPATEG